MRVLVLVFGFLLAAIAMAQGIPAPEDSGIAILDLIKNYLFNVPESILISIIGAVEIVLRFVPTRVPMSLLVPIQKVLVILGFIVAWCAAFVGRLVAVANRIKS